MVDKTDGPNGEPKQGVQKAPRFMAAEVAIDWQHEIVIVQEMSKQNIALLQPLAFAIPLDVFINMGLSATIEKLKRVSQEKQAQAKLGVKGA